MSTAYLVGYLNLNVNPPTLSRVGIFSENSNSLTITSNHYAFDIIEVQGSSYNDAYNQMIEYLSDTRTKVFFKWVYEFLSREIERDIKSCIAANEMNEALE